MTFKRTAYGIIPLLIILYAASAAAKKEENTEQKCKDGQDNDEDGFTDCDDQDCIYFVFCTQKNKEEAEPEPEPPPPQNLENTIDLCRDYKDNDADGHIDCDDQDCSIFVFCVGYGAGAKAGAGLKKEPHESRGGIGMYPTLVVFGAGKLIGDVKNSNQDQRAEYKMKVTAGIGIFGEFLAAPHFAIGGEINLTFPKIDEGRAYDSVGRQWSEWAECKTCETSVLFNLMVRMKFPVRAGRWASVYPLVTFGMSSMSYRSEHADAQNFLGLGYSAGMGFEVYTPTVVTPCFELRYLGGTAMRVDMTHLEEAAYESQTSLYHSIALNFGIRFL
jgi:hypothetical protein